MAGTSAAGTCVSALLCGQSGTGKTFAAEALSRTSYARPVSHRLVADRQQVHRRNGKNLRAGL